MQDHTIYSPSITEIDQLYAIRHWSEQLINDDSVFLYVLSPIGNIIYCSNNNSCKKITSYDATDLIGQSISQFLHPDEHIPFFQTLKQIFDVPHRMSKIQFRWKIKHSPGYYLFLQSFGYSKQDNDMIPHYNILNSSSSTQHHHQHTLEPNYSAFFTIIAQNPHPHHPAYDPATYDFLMKLKMENQLLQQRIIQLTNSTMSNNNSSSSINININSNNNNNSNDDENNNELCSNSNINDSSNNNNTINIINDNQHINIVNHNHTHNNLIHFYNNNNFNNQNTTGSNQNNNSHNNNDNNNSLNTPRSEPSLTSTTSNPFPMIEYDSNSIQPSTSQPVINTATIHFAPPSTSSSIDKFNNNNMLHTSSPPSSSSSSSWVSTNWQQSTPNPNFPLNFPINEHIKKETLKKENDKEEKKKKAKKNICYIRKLSMYGLWK